MLAVQAFSQLTVKATTDIDKLVKNVLIGSGVTVSNITFKGDTSAIGFFDGRNSNIGLDSGIIISTGHAVDAVGPNNTNISTSNNEGSDPDLNTIADGVTVDAAYLKFDFIPISDKIKFRFVFGSEEYPEFVGQNYNDVFGFFINGPGFVGNQNIALIPGTNIPISIETINSNTNAQYYTNNANGTTVQYDAFTKVIEIVATVTPCESYTIKMAIADVLDRAYDSGIFIEAQSFKSDRDDNVIVKRAYPPNVRPVVEGCDSAIFRFQRTSTNMTNALQVNYILSGEATAGADYNLLPGTITIPANQPFAEVIVYPTSDGIQEGTEYLGITINNPGVCFVSTASVNITDLTAPKVDVFNTVGCIKDTIFKQASIGGGSGDFTYVWTDSLGQVVSYGAVLAASPDSLTMYIVEVTDNCSGQTVKDTTYIPPIIPVKIITIGDTVVCGGDLLQLNATCNHPNPQYSWSSTAGLFNNRFIANPTFLVPSSIYSMLVKVTITNEDACPEDKIFTIRVIPKGVVDKDVFICEQGSPQLQAYGGKTYKWTPSQGLSADNIANPTVSAAGVYNVVITDSINCTYNATVTVIVDNMPVANAGEDKRICKRSEVQLQASGSQYNDYEWEPRTSLDNYTSPTPKATPTVTTSYILKAINNACFDYDTVIVYVIDSAKADFEILIDSCTQTVSIQNKTTGTDSVFWDFGDGYTTTESNPTHIYDSVGSYTIYLEANRNTLCNDIKTMDVVFSESDISKRIIPNVITPNGDGINDYFKVTGGGVQCRLESISIYNRWGKLLYQTNDKSNLTWDGKVNNETVTPGVYFYVVEGKGFKDTGTITVIE